MSIQFPYIANIIHITDNRQKITAQKQRIGRMVMEMVVFLAVFVIVGIDCDTDNGSNRNPADSISSEMVLGAVSDYAAVHCGYVGHHCAV